VIDDSLFEGEFGRIRSVVEGHDGALYLLTSNRDGRGEPSNDDDRIIRLAVRRHEHEPAPTLVSAR
jgi:glucose/arabinose dehydrogenase